MTHPRDREIRRALVATFVARTAANGGLRVVYPFLPAIARGLGVSPAALATLVAVRNLGGLATPWAARASERYGRRWMMATASAAVAVGCVLAALTGSFALASVGIVLIGVAKPAFDVAMQSWFGDRVPYHERGRVFGITELTWSVAFVIAGPVAGLLIDAFDWRAPFVLLAALAVAGTLAIVRGIGRDAPQARSRRVLRLQGPRLRVLVAVLLFSLASEVVFIVYGQWLEGSLGLSIAGIGTFTLVVVMAELVGEGLVTAYADRWGLRRMLLSGLLLSAVAYLSFSITGSTLALAVVVVTVWIVAFEVTIVVAIPFVSELAVEARDRMLSFFAVTFTIGRAIGALGGQALYAAGGISAVGLVSSACALAATALLLDVREPVATADDSEPSVPRLK